MLPNFRPNNDIHRIFVLPPEFILFGLTGFV